MPSSRAGIRDEPLNETDAPTLGPQSLLHKHLKGQAGGCFQESEAMGMIFWIPVFIRLG